MIPPHKRDNVTANYRSLSCIMVKMTTCLYAVKIDTFPFPILGK